ncbi:MAG: RNB domain-containing ribonuclease, partial [Sphingopyxis sp.]
MTGNGPRTPAGLPSRDRILAFITQSREPAGKREIAKAFGLRGPEKIALKALLKDMADEGLIDSAPGRAFHKMGGLPKVTVLRVADIDGGVPVAVPERWEGSGPPPRVSIVEKGRRSAVGVGDRLLCRIEDAGAGYRGLPIRKLEATAQDQIGILEEESGPGGKPMLWLRSIDKRNRREWPVSDAGLAAPGDLVLAQMAGRPPRQTVKVTQRLADPFAPRSLSLIAIHKYGLPHQFADDIMAEAERVAALPLLDPSREDLTHIPIIAIDPRDARDHDDAIWVMPDDDAGNPGGFRAIVAIADVSFYVRPGSDLDREARKRGNSVYFPDQVVPMLPHILSSGVCSLKSGVDRAAMACHLVIDAAGKVTSWRFTRARVRLAANIAYEDAQAMIDGHPPANADLPGADIAAILRPLWAAWG